MMLEIGTEFEQSAQQSSSKLSITWLQLFTYDFGFAKTSMPLSWNTHVFDKSHEESILLFIMYFNLNDIACRIENDPSDCQPSSLDNHNLH